MDLKIDKTALSLVPLFDESEDRAYWFSRTPHERLRHMEALRRINYGDRATARLQRVLELVEGPLISLAHLKANKKASGRFKDLDDLEHLP